MAPLKPDPDVVDRLAMLKSNGVKSVPVNDITEIVESILDSLNGDVSAIDATLVGELESLSTFIRTARGDIAAIRPESVREEHIPAAKDELDAIVGATERATDDIMSEAEKIQVIAEGLDDESADALNNHVMQIYEACSFQDITGQRITKVVQTLLKIETSVESLLAIFGDEMARERVREMEEDKQKRETAPDGELLQGPQLEGGGNTQDEIDNILASFD